MSYDSSYLYQHGCAAAGLPRQDSHSSMLRTQYRFFEEEGERHLKGLALPGPGALTSCSS